MKIKNQPYMLAQISKGENEWYVYYSFQYPASDPKHPAFKQFKDRGGINYIKEIKERKQAAEALRDAYNERLRAGWSPFGIQVSNDEEYDQLKFSPALVVLDKMYELKKNVIKGRTWQSYKYSLDVFRQWMQKKNRQGRMLPDIKPKDITAFIDSLIESKAGNKSINNHAGNLGVLFNMTVERELITKSPWSSFTKLPTESGKNFPFSEKQKTDLKKKILADDPDLWPFVKSIYHLFVRPIELLRVKIKDVDLRTNQIIIQSEVGKNKKQLPVQIPESFIDEIRAMNLGQYPGDWFLFGKKREGGFSKFQYRIQPSPSSFSRNTMTKRHAEILKACGITNPDYTMYGWKHTGNVDAYLAGVDIYDLMRQNRHHSIEQTMTYLRSLGLKPNVGFSTKAPKL